MTFWKTLCSGGRDRIEQWAPRLSVFAVPVLVLACAGVLTALDLNGSSIGLLSPNYQTDPSLIAGAPRVIRSDEWNISSTNAIGSVRRDGMVQPWVGLTPTYLPLTNIPSAHWTEAFKPSDWGYGLLSPSRGFAFRWWIPLVIGLLGVYALVWVLTRSLLLASGLAAVVAFAPTTAWWSQSPALLIGAMAGATACALTGMAAKRTRSALAWGLASGYLFVAAFFTLYPPWLVSLGWVCLAVIVGWALDTRPRPIRIVASAATALTVFGTSILVWYVQAREGILATANTYYPGKRISTSGGASLAWLLDGPVSLWTSKIYAPALQAPGRTFLGDPIPSVNPSEVSSTWLPLPLLAACVVMFGWASWKAWHSRRLQSLSAEADTGTTDLRQNRTPLEISGGDDIHSANNRPLLWTGWCLTAVTVLLLAWALLPLPRVFGSLTGLDRVPGPRLTVALGLAAVLLVAVATTIARGRHLPRWLLVLLVVAAAATVAAMVWAVRSLPWDTALGVPNSAKVALVATAFTVGVLAVCLGRFAGFGALIAGAVAVAVYVPVNPLYRGLGPLDRDPLVKALLPYGLSNHPPRTAVYGDWLTVALVSASGVQNLSGVTFYPDEDVWRQLAPSQEGLWNSFSKYLWVVDADATPATIEVVQGTQRTLRINPCAPRTLALRIDLTVSTAPIKLPCLRPIGVVHRPGRGSCYLYRTRQAASLAHP